MHTTRCSCPASFRPHQRAEVRDPTSHFPRKAVLPLWWGSSLRTRFAHEFWDAWSRRAPVRSESGLRKGAWREHGRLCQLCSRLRPCVLFTKCVVTATYMGANTWQAVQSVFTYLSPPAAPAVLCVTLLASSSSQSMRTPSLPMTSGHLHVLLYCLDCSSQALPVGPSAFILSLLKHQLLRGLCLPPPWPVLSILCIICLHADSLSPPSECLLGGGGSGGPAYGCAPWRLQREFSGFC